MITKPFRVSLFALCLSAALLISYENRICTEPSRPTAENRASKRAGTRLRRSVPASTAFALPLAFVPSEASTADVQFIGRGTKVALAMTRDGIKVSTGSRSSTQVASVRLRFLMRDSRTPSRLVWKGIDKLRSESNYFIGSDPKKGRTHVPHFERVETALGGIGIVAYGNEGGLEYDLRIPPGADASELRLAVEGARDLRTESKW